MLTGNSVRAQAMAMEDRINDHNGVKIANLEAAIGRVGAGFDDAMGALSKRLVDLEASLLNAGDRGQRSGQLLIELQSRRARLLNRSRSESGKTKRDVHRDGAIRLEAERYRAHVDECPCHQACGDQQLQRQRQLHRHQ